MSDKDLKAMRALDDEAEKAGGYVSIPREDAPRYDYRAIVKHCKEKGIDPLDMTTRDMQKFVRK